MYSNCNGRGMCVTNENCCNSESGVGLNISVSDVPSWHEIGEIVLLEYQSKSYEFSWILIHLHY